MEVWQLVAGMVADDDEERTFVFLRVKVSLSK